jgi:hypothetical protein
MKNTIIAVKKSTGTAARPAKIREQRVDIIQPFRHPKTSTTSLEQRSADAKIANNAIGLTLIGKWLTRHQHLHTDGGYWMRILCKLAPMKTTKMRITITMMKTPDDQIPALFVS